jgi:ADP-ribose pyrophosphatase YjhB (NUDIX family)
VVTIIPYQDGIVTIRRGNAPHIGGLALPGGFMDWTSHPETWEETAVREAHEEAQVELNPLALTLLGIRTSPSGSLVVVCKSPRLETLGDFVPSVEATERVILRDPEQLCFPIQADFAREMMIQ